MSINQTSDNPQAITVFCAGAARIAIASLADKFLASGGFEITFIFDTVGMLKERLLQGQTADIVIATDIMLAEMAAANKISKETTVELGQTGIGVGTQEGHSIPDISTPETFRNVLLNAKSVTYADPNKGATSGIYFSHVLRQMEIADVVNAKSILLPGNSVMKAVAAGKAEFGIQQVTEIFPVPGVVLVGPLPAELQKITVYSAGITTMSINPIGASKFLSFISDPKAEATFVSSGFGIF